jgi:hypothetical protein
MLPHRLLPACVTICLLTAATPRSVDPATALAGRYDAEFPDGLTSGETYTGRDVVEVVLVASRAAYLRFHLDFYNGHICSLSGIAKAEGDALVLRQAAEIAGGSGCTLTVRRAGKTLAWSDPANGCQSYCGIRGSFMSGAVPWASRQPITYLARLKGSRQYRAALSAWQR